MQWTPFAKVALLAPRDELLCQANYVVLGAAVQQQSTKLRFAAARAIAEGGGKRTAFSSGNADTT